MRLFVVLGVIVAGCAAPLPPERVERDRAIMTAIQPCRTKYPEFFHMDHVYVRQDGLLRWWYPDHLEGRLSEVQQCVAEALKDLKVGARAPGRLAGAGPASVPTEARGRVFVAPTLVNGVSARLLVDTGAAITIVHPALARKAGIDIVSESPTVPLVGLGGKTVTVPYATARSVSVGDALVADLPVGVFDAMPDMHDIDGVLGNNFLSHFKVMVDQQRARLALEPLQPRAPAASAPQPLEIAVTSREWRMPAWTVGDEWELRWEGPAGKGTYVQTVEAEESVDGVAHYVMKSGARRTYFVKDTLAWHFEKNGDGAVTLRRTPALAFAWPLSSGKSWRQKYQRREGRNTEEVNLTCKALEEGSTSVPAGTFKTLRIRCDTPTRVVWEWWYADEVKHWVRRRSVRNAGDRVDELVSYSPVSAKTTRVSGALQ